MYKIRQALAYWSELTCINFRENRSAEHKLMFTRGRGCWSYVGFTHQVNQTVSIGDGCQSNGTIAHEVGHAIGFWHEQSRPDRDDYILIHKHNVTAGKLYNFDKRTWGEIVTLNIPYDLGSDMHYGSKFYAKDANSSYTTVETRDPLMLRVIGQRQELSFFDVKLANKAYCEDVCKNSGVRQQEPCQRDGYQDPLDCRRCRCPDGFGGLYCESVETGVNAYCGGVLDARYNGTIYSPGYPAPGYHPGVQCSWLIKAPSGSRVYLQFVSDFGVAGHVDVCKDYVEVRYNSSLALTGARFCCSDPPRHAIGSETNEMLVLFRSFNDSRVCDDTKYPWKCKIISKGFKAIFYMESCGGCGRYRSGHQPACSRRVAYVCAQSWQEKVKMDCPEWWYTGSCGVRHIHRVRYVTCHKDQPYCCDGFTLQARFCVASGREFQAVKRDSHASNRKRIGNDKSTPYWRSPSPSPGYRVFSSTVAASVPLWLPWSEWSNCSRRCGGDIVRRIRRCARPGSCGKRNLHIDLRSCASKPCYTKCRITKKILCDLWTTCTRTVYELCKPYCHIGFALKDDRYCVASAG
ncbi:Zinc metalloproteinase nas-36 [Lamellibrachia satsuma]|nr:Zinc metalloproteinase nas-36 [Lamellibrachia satsuma]